MENQITSTTYVPLQPPYQIIKYADDLAMQIGTLIVTIQKEGDINGMGYEIETHSHPVVVYENKRTAPIDKELFSNQFLEGVVWSRVQVKDVSTVCLETSCLPWEEFVEYLRVDMMRHRGVPSPAVHTYDTLLKLGAQVLRPECKEYTVKLQYSPRSDVRCVETPYRSLLALCAECTDETVMLGQLKQQIFNYMWVLHRNNIMDGFSITYETDEESLRAVVDQLNSDKQCTDKGARHITSNPLIVHPVFPYPGTETKNE